MEKIKRKVMLYIVSYGRLLAFIIGIILITVFVLNTLNDYVVEKNLSNNIVLTEEEKIKIEEEKKKEEQEIKYISKFIEYCNTGKIEEAYMMLSDENKSEKYNNIEKFKEEYIRKIFDIYICDYDILKKDDEYEITLVEDILLTGKIDSTKKQIYKITGILETKIHICEFK